MGLRLKTVAVLLLVLIGLTGCGRTLVLHPIEQSDIQIMKTGEAYTPEKDGYFLSEFYMEEVIKAKIK